MCKLKKKDVREFFFEGKDVRESKKKENRWSDYIKKKNWSLEKEGRIEEGNKIYSDMETEQGVTRQLDWTKF